MVRPEQTKRLALVVLVAALPLLGWGLYIPAKARLAQWLLHAAWQRTLEGQGPMRPWPWADTWPVARLQVPEHGIDQIVLMGDSGAVLAFGPGLNRRTVFPGKRGNAVISAHRDTHFGFLQHLQTEDILWITGRDGIPLRFAVRRTAIVDARHARLRIGLDQAFISLVTCYPFGAMTPGGPLRYVVIAERVGDAAKDLRARSVSPAPAGIWRASPGGPARPAR